jgi:hypothetical protein
MVSGEERAAQSKLKAGSDAAEKHWRATLMITDD